VILCRSSFPFVYVQDVAEAICRAAEKPGNIGAKYLLVGENLTFGQINAMVAEISGVSLPPLRLPNVLTFATAAALTAISRVLGRPPMWGMSLDQIRTMANGPIANGSKAERELGIRYTPIRRALQDAIGFQGQAP
jgi:dihydroflavonol-4-reductase